MNQLLRKVAFNAVVLGMNVAFLLDNITEGRLLWIGVGMIGVSASASAFVGRYSELRDRFDTIDTIIENMNRILRRR